MLFEMLVWTNSMVPVVRLQGDQKCWPLTAFTVLTWMDVKTFENLLPWFIQVTQKEADGASCHIVPMLDGASNQRLWARACPKLF